MSIQERFGWPTCAICHKPVDKLYHYTLYGKYPLATLVFVVECHGQKEIVEFNNVEDYVLADDMHFPDIKLDGLAFNNKKIAGTV